MEGRDFLPLTVEYREKAYAGGKIPGGFFKREGRPDEKETLTCRLIDRPIRPLFPKGFRNEIQVINLVISADNENDPDMFSQRVLLRLAETGLPRQQAYEMVQRNAMRAWRERAPFRAFLDADPEVTARLTAADLDACFDPTWYLRNVDAIYKRAGLS